METKNIVIAVVVLAVLGVAGYFGFKEYANPKEVVVEETATTTPQTTNAEGVVDLGQGLYIKDVTVGTGTPATAGRRVYVKYVGRLTNETVFDASEFHSEMKDTGYSFVLGNDQVIAGWHMGIAGMKVGGQRLLQIPPALGYGAQPMKGVDQNGKEVEVIPADSTLVFAVELVKVE